MAEAIITVNGTALPNPSSLEWGLQDVSKSDAGRTEDGLMHKNRVAQKRKIKLEWKMKTWADTAKIIAAVNPEYIKVRYPDMMSCQYETRTFYVGDRSAPVKLWWDGKKYIEKVSFDLIER